MRYVYFILLFTSAFTAAGQGWYDAIPPVKVPTTTVQKARPVDALAAWNKANTDGAARGEEIMTKLLEMKRKSLLYDFSNPRPVRYVSLVDKKYNSFLDELVAKLKSDPAYFNGYAIETELLNKAQRILSPRFLIQGSEQYKYFDEMERKAINDGTINNVAFANGRPLDYTYKDLFQLFRFNDTAEFDYVFGTKDQSGQLVRDTEGYPVFF